MAYFQRLIKLERLFPEKPEYKFENITFGEEAPTMAVAIEMVEQDIKTYVESKRKQEKKKELEEEPFPSKKPDWKNGKFVQMAKAEVEEIVRNQENSLKK